MITRPACFLCKFQSAWALATSVFGDVLVSCKRMCQHTPVNLVPLRMKWTGCCCWHGGVIRYCSIVFLRKPVPLGIKWACCCCIRSTSASCRRDAPIKGHVLAHVGHSLSQVSWIPLTSWPHYLHTFRRRQWRRYHQARGRRVCEARGVFVRHVLRQRHPGPSCTPPATSRFCLLMRANTAQSSVHACSFARCWVCSLSPLLGLLFCPLLGLLFIHRCEGIFCCFVGFALPRSLALSCTEKKSL